MRLAPIVGAACGAIWIVATTATAQGVKILNGVEIRTLIGSGVTLNFTDVKGGSDYSGTTTLNSDGSGSGAVTLKGKPPATYSGKWVIKGNKFCRAWTPLDKSEVCETWKKTSDKEVTTYVNGKPASLLKLP